MTLRCDNEPVLVQVLRMTVNARLSMGLPTRASTPMAYSFKFFGGERCWTCTSSGWKLDVCVE